MRDEEVVEQAWCLKKTSTCIEFFMARCPTSWLGKVIKLQPPLKAREKKTGGWSEVDTWKPVQ